MCLGCVQRFLSFCLEICRVNSVKTHDFRWNGELRWVGCAGAAWNGSRRRISCLWYVWGDRKLLFSPLLLKRWHDVSSTYSRYWAHPLTAAFFILWGLWTGCLQLLECWAAHFFGFQLFLLISPITFESNNHRINVFRAVGFIWVPFGLLSSAETL